MILRPYKKTESTGNYISINRYKKILKGHIRKGNFNMSFITSGNAFLKKGK